MALRELSIKQPLIQVQAPKLAKLFLICLLFMGSLQVLLFAGTVEAADNPVVTVRIETPGKTIWSGQVEVQGCTIADANGAAHVIDGPKAACALVAAANQGGFGYTFEDSGWGLYLNEVDGIESDFSNFWLYRVNYSSPPIGLADYELSNGDELLVSFGPWPDTPLGVSSSTQVQVGEQFTILSSYYDDNQNDFLPIGDAKVYLGTSVLQTDQQGNLTASLSQAGVYPLYIEKDGYVRSARMQVEAIDTAKSGVQVNVSIVNIDQNLWQGNVVVDTTEFLDSDGNSHSIEHPTALGALVEACEASSLPIEIASSSYGFYVVSVAGISPQGWDGWNYKVDGESPFVGMGAYDISDGDNIVIYYSIWPWKLEADKTSVQVGEEVVFTAYQYDSSNKQWQISSDTTIKIGDAEYQTDQDGTITRTFEQQGGYEAYISSGGWQNSQSVTITVSEKIPQEPPVSREELYLSAQKALDYLRNQQGEDGSIENAGVSAWCAIAFGAAGIYPENVSKQELSLADYLRTYVPAPTDSATDFARQILAALASGQNPRGFGTDLIDGLKAFHQEQQIGEKGLVNDDVFAVVALLAAGENVDQEIIRDGIGYIVSHQNGDGGFSYSTAGISDTDTTCAAIQALILAKGKGYSGPSDLDAASMNAKDFLKQAQNDDGGFPYSKGGMFPDSNSATTSWAIQALIAMGEDLSDWKTADGATPYHFLLGLQKEDGSFSWTGKDPGQNLMTAYAIPALFGQAWPVVLAEKPNTTTSPSLQYDQTAANYADQSNADNSHNASKEQNGAGESTGGVLPFTGFCILYVIIGLIATLIGSRLWFLGSKHERR